MSKAQLGQFYTDNVDYILEGFEDLVKNKNVVDAFAGEGDLLNWAESNLSASTAGYDIASKLYPYNDSLLNPIECEFSLTNPPYLAKNKAKDKTYFIKYGVDDLFRAYLMSVECDEGIAIIPVNFLSASRDLSCRKKFLAKYTITKMKLFQEQVFKDTSSTVIAMHFVKGKHSGEFPLTIMPSGDIRQVELLPKYNYRYGADYFKLLDTKPIIASRLLEGQSEPNSKILLHALDGGSKNNRIRLEITDTPYYGKQSDRSKAHIVFTKTLGDKEQEFIVKEFNTILEDLRTKYDSLFLSNYRESSSLYARKRISFTDAYKLISYIATKIK